MEISKEILDITLILLPGLFAFVIAEALTPQNKSEFERSVIYVIALSAMSFFIALGFWKLYYLISKSLYYLPQIPNLQFDNIFSFHSSYPFAFLVFIIAIVLGIFFAWVININLIYKFMNKLGTSNMTSNMEVWDDFFSLKRENSFVVVRDINNNLMYYGCVNYYSIGTTSQMVALHLTDVDVFVNSSSEMLYNVQELYLPFHSESMTVEFPDFQTKHQGE